MLDIALSKACHIVPYMGTHSLNSSLLKVGTPKAAIIYSLAHILFKNFSQPGIAEKYIHPSQEFIISFVLAKITGKWACHKLGYPITWREVTKLELIMLSEIIIIESINVMWKNFAKNFGHDFN